MSTAGVRVRPAAERDLHNIGRWYRVEGGQSLADRFTSAAQDAFEMIAEIPGLGSPAEAEVPALAAARRFRIEGFPNHRVFYMQHPRGGVIILRILHTSQDWKRR